MALVHQNLYESGDLSNIDVRSYISTLANSLLSGYHKGLSKIQLKLDLDKIRLPIETAIPFGLLINEVLSNALRHAFPGDRKGEIFVAFHLGKDGELELRIGDNGIGLPEDIEMKSTTSMGLRIIGDLAEYQLKGKLYLNRDNGTEYRIAFKTSPEKSRLEK